MLPKFALLPLVLALALPTCKKTPQVKTIGETPTPVPTATPEPSAAGASGAAVPGKVAVDQTAQVLVFGYHRFVNQVRRPDTEITPQMFEQQMQELKDRGISVIGMQDFLAWKRGEKNIPPRSAIISFDDGWKSQYDVAWPIMKKFGYPLTLFIYTEGVRGGHFGGGEAITWEQLAEMRDAGVDIEAHSETHSDLRKPYDKIAKKKLNPAEYEQWLHNEIVRCKETLEQRLGIRVNCFAVPYGYYNKHIEEVCMQAGYEALFTVYGQPITFRSSMDSLGRYLIEGNKPKVFSDAISMIATSSAGGAPVAEFGAVNLQAKPGDGETVNTATPLISANLAAFGVIDPGSVVMRVSGLGVVPATFDAKTNTVSYQVTQKLRDKVTVIVEAKSQGKKAEAHWTFAVAEKSNASPAPSATPGTPKK
jgi:peptidoglycan/xylan/chitin deacetylase (PgdA/CDA1 family)